VHVKPVDSILRSLCTMIVCVNLRRNVRNNFLRKPSYLITFIDGNFTKLHQIIFDWFIIIIISRVIKSDIIDGDKFFSPTRTWVSLQRRTADRRSDEKKTYPLLFMEVSTENRNRLVLVCRHSRPPRSEYGL